MDALSPIPHLQDLIGGGLIGISATFLLLLNGRIAGVSGILGGLFERGHTTSGWRYAFLSGLILGGWICAQTLPSAFGPEEGLNSPFWLKAIALFLVGIGAGLANGCTSGHGICGLARRSVRSLMATLSFMLCALLTASLYHGHA